MPCGESLQQQELNNSEQHGALERWVICSLAPGEAGKLQEPLSGVQKVNVLTAPENEIAAVSFFLPKLAQL